MLDRVIDKCRQSATHINVKRQGIDCEVCIVVPYNDPLIEKYTGKITVIEGPENDVLTRYMNVFSVYDDFDYLVRITSDCPLLKPPIISKHILSAVHDENDYTTNADERFRTAPDGFDVEVISSKLLRWAHENSADAYDREHVTPVIKRCMPHWVKKGHVIDHVDMSFVKISVDTEDDLSNVQDNVKAVKSKHQALKDHGWKVYWL